MTGPGPAATQRDDTVRVFRRAPAPALRPFLRRLLVVEFASLHRDTHLPDTGPVAAFSFRGGCHIGGGGEERPAPLAAFTGLHHALRAHEHDAGHCVLLATFTPAGAAALLRPPLEEFTGTTADLGDVLCARLELDRLRERIAEAPDHERRVGLLEAFLFARLPTSEPDPLVAAAVSWLERGAGGRRRIEGLARYVGLSQSALERRFRRVVGVTPKRFASLVRFGEAVRLRAAGTEGAAAARAAGYYDQSHFLREFRRVTGSAPDAFFGRGGSEP